MYTIMFTVCFIAEVKIPSSQWQCSFSHISSIFSFSSLFFTTVFIIKSIINPEIIPIVNFIPKIVNIVLAGTASVNNIGSISSDVARYTEINVPNVITLPAYKLVADTEKPHWGKIPTIAPSKGPNLPDFFMVSFILLLVLCSIYSIIRYVINRNGINFNVSIAVSCNISIISCIFSS